MNLNAAGLPIGLSWSAALRISEQWLLGECRGGQRVQQRECLAQCLAPPNVHGREDAARFLLLTLAALSFLRVSRNIPSNLMTASSTLSACGAAHEWER